MEFLNPSGIEDWLSQQNKSLTKKMFDIVLNWIEMHTLNMYHKTMIPLPKSNYVTVSDIVRLLKVQMNRNGEKELLSDLKCWKRLMQVEIDFRNCDSSSSDNKNKSDLLKWDEMQWIAQNFENIACHQKEFVCMQLKTMPLNQRHICFDKFIKNKEKYPEIIKDYFLR